MTTDDDDTALEIELEILDHLEANAESGFHPVVMVFTGAQGCPRVFSPLEGAELVSLLRVLAEVVAREGDGTDGPIASSPIAVPEAGADDITELREMCAQMREEGCSVLLAAFIDSEGNVRMTTHPTLTDPAALLGDLADDVVVDPSPTDA